MRYAKLLEFCELIMATKADEGDLADFHVKPDGYIEKAWVRVLIAIHCEHDFDIKLYMQNLVDSPLDTPPRKFLN